MCPSGVRPIDATLQSGNQCVLSIDHRKVGFCRANLTTYDRFCRANLTTYDRFCRANLTPYDRFCRANLTTYDRFCRANLTTYDRFCRANLTTYDRFQLMRWIESITTYYISERSSPVSLLLISIAGSTPAFTLYMASIFYRKPNKVLFIVNMLIRSTSFNLIPVFDSLAFTRHQGIKMVSLKCYRSLRHQITLESRTNQWTTSVSSFSLSYHSHIRQSQSM